MKTVTYRKDSKVIKQWYHRMLLGYRIAVCLTRNNLYSDEEVFSSSSHTQDRIVPTDTGTKPRNNNTPYLLFQHPTKKSLPPLQHTCNCQAQHKQLRMSTQPQQQTSVTLNPHHRKENTAPQDQTWTQAYCTPWRMNRLGTYTTLS